VLGHAERRALAEALLADVLHPLTTAPEVERVLVVSADPAALTLAARLGATPLLEAPLGSADRAAPPEDLDAEAALNHALDQAAATAEANGVAALLALPADLPLVTPADVAALAADPLPAPAIVVAATADGGTGALLRCPPLAIPARFGADSLRSHLAAAARRGVRARLVWRPNLAVDVDTPPDLERLAALPTLGGHTGAWLAAWRAAAHVGR
jgi:2-phospho-L-lactate guanylyltransferase